MKEVRQEVGATTFVSFVTGLQTVLAPSMDEVDAISEALHDGLAGVRPCRVKNKVSEILVKV